MRKRKVYVKNLISDSIVGYGFPAAALFPVPILDFAAWILEIAVPLASFFRRNMICISNGTEIKEESL